MNKLERLKINLEKIITTDELLLLRGGGYTSDNICCCCHSGTSGDCTSEYFATYTDDMDTALVDAETECGNGNVGCTKSDGVNCDVV